MDEVVPLELFYLAEDVHQNYLEELPEGYCHINLELINEKVMMIEYEGL